MRFEWDEAKNRQNLAKHRISFEMATLVFDDPHALSDRDQILGDEERWQTIGTIGSVAVFVAHTWWEDADCDSPDLSSKGERNGKEAL